MLKRILSLFRSRTHNSLYWAQKRLQQLQANDFKAAAVSARKANEALAREMAEVRHG